MKVHAIRILASSTLLAAGMLASEPAGAPAALQPAAQRKSAPEFALPDSTGKMVTLKDYRGKVVLLDFWATWCHGCKMEIPWFAEFSRKYGDKGVAVGGGLLGFAGWEKGAPLIKNAPGPYQNVFRGDLVLWGDGIEKKPQ